MKKIFNAVAPIGRVLFGNGRYIHYDGSAHGSKGVARYVQQPEVLAGAYTAIAVAATTLFLKDPNAATMSFVSNLQSLALGLAVKAMNDAVVFRKVKPDAAIDTEGRDLDPHSLSLQNFSDLKHNRNFSLLGVSALTSLTTVGLFSDPFDPDHASQVAVGVGIFAKQFWNSSQLLKGDYQFCDKKPPEKKSFSLSSLSPFGKTAPSAP